MTTAQIPIIAFDEAGNTGQNLLDNSQPIFSLASVNFDEDELNELFGIFDTNSDELHFKRLRKYSKTQKQLIEFCDHELIQFSKIKYSLSDKRFALVAQIIDQLFEPVMYDLNVDIYKYGMNIGLANSLYTFCNISWNKELVDEMLSNFVKMIKTKSEDSVQDFYSTLKKLYPTVKKEQQQILTPILASEFQIESILSSVFKYTIDLTYPAFSVLCDWWYRELGSKFEVMHDNSKQIDYWQELIKFTSNQEFMEEREVGYDSRKMIYPLKINELKLVDSKEHRQIQIADLVASSVAFVLKNLREGKNDELTNKLIQTKMFNMEHHAIAPSNKISPEELEMERGEGENPLDYLAEMFVKSKDKYENIESKLKEK